MRALIAQPKYTRGLSTLLLFVLVFSMQSFAISAEILENAQSHVGVSARVEQLVLPGPKLEVRPLADRKLPLVLRIEQSYPHGSDFRYDLVYYGLEPGEYDLGDYLQREDASPADDLPPLPVKILGSLPPGQIEPNALQSSGVPRLGGYRILAVLAGALWLAGLATILLFGRKVDVVEAALANRQLSLEEDMRIVLERIGSGRFTESDKSHLERLLLAYWRRRLGLQNAKPAEAMAAIRANPAAAHLLDQLERWLHQPAGAESVDVVELLRPYRQAFGAGPTAQRGKAAGAARQFAEGSPK